MAIRRTAIDDALGARSAWAAWLPRPRLRIPLRSFELTLVALGALVVAGAAAAGALRAVGIPWPTNTVGAVVVTTGVTLWRDARHGRVAGTTPATRARIRRRRGG